MLRSIQSKWVTINTTLESNLHFTPWVLLQKQSRLASGRIAWLWIVSLGDIAGMLSFRNTSPWSSCSQPLLRLSGETGGVTCPVILSLQLPLLQLWRKHSDQRGSHSWWAYTSDLRGTFPAAGAVAKSEWWGHLWDFCMEWTRGQASQWDTVVSTHSPWVCCYLRLLQWCISLTSFPQLHKERSICIRHHSEVAWNRNIGFLSSCAYWPDCSHMDGLSRRCFNMD